MRTTIASCTYLTLVVAALSLECGCSTQNPSVEQSPGSSNDEARATVLNNRGLTKALAGEFDTAIDDFTEAIKFDPNCADAYYNRGWCRYEKGDADPAIEDFSKAIKIDANRADA